MRGHESDPPETGLYLHILMSTPARRFPSALLASFKKTLRGTNPIIVEFQLGFLWIFSRIIKLAIVCLGNLIRIWITLEISRWFESKGKSFPNDMKFARLIWSMIGERVRTHRHAGANYRQTVSFFGEKLKRRVMEIFTSAARDPSGIIIRMGPRLQRHLRNSQF